MRIAMVSEHANPLARIGGVDAGGQNVHVAELSRALARQGDEVTVYTRRDDPDVPERVPLAPGVDVVHVAAGPARRLPKDELLPYMAELGEGLAAAWRADPPDVVHAHFWMSGLAAVTAAAHGGLESPPPVLETFHALGSVKRRHQGADDTSPPEREWIEPMVGRMVDRVVATCPDEVRELRALGIPGGRVSVVPCGVDVEAFRPDGLRSPLDEPLRVVSVGRLVPRKGVDLLVEALALLGRRDVELVVAGGEGGPAGSEPEAGRLAAIARALGVADRVVLLGQVPPEEMPVLLRSAAVVACVPWYEPFGIVPLEAMACGVPVLVSAVGGLQETVVDGVTGVHVAPRDPASIAAALARLLDSPEDRARMGEAGRRRVVERYTWDHVAAQTARIYRSAVTRAARHGSRLAGAAR